MSEGITVEQMACARIPTDVGEFSLCPVSYTHLTLPTNREV